MSGVVRGPVDAEAAGELLEGLRHLALGDRQVAVRVEERLLRRVGGGYIFVHRLLMEHFASLTEEDIKRLASSSDGR